MFTEPFRFFTDECRFCRRPRKPYWGNRNGWCLYCEQWYRRNGSDWVIRCLNRAGNERLTLQCESRVYVLPARCKALVLDYMAGSTRRMRVLFRRQMWERILLGMNLTAEEYSDSSEDEDDEAYFARKAAHVDTPLFWKLQLTFRSGENLLKSVIRFIV